MSKHIFPLLIVLTLLFSAGCSGLPKIGSSTSTPTGSFQIINKAQLGTKWQMYQLKAEVGSAGLPIVLKLADGDKVDGYFYTDKGDNVGFRVIANTPVYESVAQGAASITGGVASDRFAFIATQGQGMSYSLTFRGPGGDKSQQTVTVYVEVIFPTTASIFVPLESK